MNTIGKAWLKSLCGVGVIAGMLAGCSGGGGSGDTSDTQERSGSSAADFDCDGNCQNLSLTQDDVSRIVSQAVAGAQQLGVAATIAVLDRVGNVLAVYQMPGAPASTTITGGRVGLQGGLEGLVVPSTLAAISKAGTGSFLSSQGNAFGTRTASLIVQENFYPTEMQQPGGPLFGVQFSQTLCSDIPTLNPEFAAGLTIAPRPANGLAGGLAGPRALPLGLSADTGGLPIYKNGDIVGGIGVEFNGTYTADLDPTNVDDDPEERIALTGTLNGFETPSDRVAERIFVLGRALRLSDLEYGDLAELPTPLPGLDPANLVSVTGFINGGVIRAGAVFGDPSSGIARTVRAGLPSMVLVDGNGNNRFPTIAGTSQGGAELQPNEVDALLDSALKTAERLRAGIRRPADSQVHVSIWVIDINGTPLGFTRSFDAPVFGIDVALQKARSALLFSSDDAGAVLTNAGFGGYVSATQALLGPNALDGSFAYGDRSIGNLARPFFLDGINNNPNGPLSLPFPGSEAAVGASATWSPFSTGLQLDLLINSLAAPLSGVIPNDCAPGLNGRLKNGLQIFAGSVPLYRGNTLIGAIGISGDGIDQDDTVAFFGSSRPGLDKIGHTDVGDADLGFNAPRDMRADTIPVALSNARLRYVNCPEAPFRGNNDQNVCDGL